MSGVLNRLFGSRTSQRDVMILFPEGKWKRCSWKVQNGKMLTVAPCDLIMCPSACLWVCRLQLEQLYFSEWVIRSCSSLYLCWERLLERCSVTHYARFEQTIYWMSFLIWSLFIFELFYHKVCHWLHFGERCPSSPPPPTSHFCFFTKAWMIGGVESHCWTTGKWSFLISPLRRVPSLVVNLLLLRVTFTHVGWCVMLSFFRSRIGYEL